MPLLQVEELSLTYHTQDSETIAIEKISFSQYENEFVSIVGPSGCGKSSLLAILAGLTSPSGGALCFLEQPLNRPLPEIGLMQQQDCLLPWLTVWENACFGLKLRKVTDEKAFEEVKAMLSDFGLGKFLRSYPHHLSGGMRQRVALIRTLALDPRLFLLDEAFSALDYQTRLELQDEVWRTLRRRGKAMLMVTHDIPEAVAMCDRVLVLSPRPGKLQCDLAIDFEGLERDNRAPLVARQHPAFGGYFNQIWRELHVERDHTDPQ